LIGAFKLQVIKPEEALNRERKTCEGETTKNATSVEKEISNGRQRGPKFRGGVHSQS